MKKILSFFICMAFVISMLPQVSFLADAATIRGSGKCGANATWTLDEYGVLTIGGTGDMSDFKSDEPHPWDAVKYEYISGYIKVSKVVIEEGVTKIGDHAFSNCYSMTDVIIADSVEEIGNNAFDIFASSMKNIVWGDGLTTIGDRAFAYFNLEELVLPDSVRNIGKEAFKNAKLKSVVLPSGLKKIEKCTFGWCDKLEEITIPDSVTSIGQEAFTNSGLKSIKLPASLKTIEDNAFYFCDEMKTAEFPDGLQSIGKSAFANCSVLRRVYLGSKLAEVKDTAFENCYKLVEANFKSTDTNFGKRVFNRCENLTIVGPEDSSAHKYAKTNSIEYNRSDKSTSGGTQNQVTQGSDGADKSVSIDTENTNTDNKKQKGFSNFVPVKAYAAGQFRDVSDSAWFSANVKKAYELDLVKGGSNGGFNPNSNMTIAEALALAARVHCIYNGKEANFVQGNPWYNVYVSYALSNGIITASEFKDYNKPINRAQFAIIFSKVVPANEYNSINNIGTIPDVSFENYFANNVYTLYNAGILTGSDKYGTFNSYSNIQRCEVATIVTRIVDKTARKTFTLEKRPAATGVNLAGKTTITVGQTTTWTAKVTPEGAEPKVYWLSGNTGVATVDQNGVITANGAGQSNITVTTSNGIKKTVLLTVVPITPTGLTLAGEVTVEAGDSVKWKATVTPAGANQWVSWNSGNPGVAKVDSNGNITGIKAGKSNITATASNGIKKTVCITVVPPLAERYKSLARTDMTRIRYEYSTAKGTEGYVYAFKNHKGEQCILVTIKYRILDLHTTSFLHNITTGQVIEDPTNYYRTMSKITHSIDNAIEYSKHAVDVAGAALTVSRAMLDITATGVNSANGVYVDAAYLK